MKITPLDIYNKEFRKKFSFVSYDRKEVDEFLDHVAAAYERLLKELNQLKDENEALETELSRYREMESTLKETLVVAQETVKERKEHAEREAQLIIETAKNRSREMMFAAKDKVKARLKQYNQVEEYEQFFRIRLKALLDSHLHLLNESKLERPEELDLLSKELAFSVEEPLDEDVNTWIDEDGTDDSPIT